MIAARAARPTLAVLVAAALAFPSRIANARGEERSIAVLTEGADAGELASRLESRLRSPCRAADADAFREAMSVHLAPRLTAATKDRKTDGKLVAHARTAAQATRADAAILVEVRRSKRATLVHVWLVDANGGGAADVEHQATLGSHASVDEQADAAWDAIGAEFSSRDERVSSRDESEAAPTETETAETATVESPPESPSPAPPPAPSGETDVDRGASGDSTPEPRDNARATSIASIRATIEAGSRNFSYVDRLTSTLRPYDLSAAPLAEVDADLYPFAHTGTPVLKDLGATFDYAMAFGLSSADSAGHAVKTSWNSFDVGLRERLSLGPSWMVGLRGDFGQIGFTFEGALDTTAELPAVTYRFLRVGIDARVDLRVLALYARGSYLDVLSTGLVGTYFSRASVGGLEGGLGVSRALGHGLEMSLEFAYTRFFYTLNPEPGDAYVAGGALDQLACASLGVAYVF